MTDYKKCKLKELHTFLMNDTEYIVIKKSDLEDMHQLLQDELCDHCYWKYSGYKPDAEDLEERKRAYR